MGEKSVARQLARVVAVIACTPKCFVAGVAQETARPVNGSDAALAGTGRGLVANPDKLEFSVHKEEWNCETKHVNWGIWPIERKAWCCQHQGEACPPGVQEPYDCSHERDDWQDTWSESKRTWCCKVRGIACKSEVYDCQSGFEDFWRGASLKKMRYCCKFSDYPCPENLVPKAYSDGIPTTTTTSTETTTKTTVTTTTATTTTTLTKTMTTVTSTVTTTTTTVTTVTTTFTVTSTETTTSITETTTTTDPVEATMACSEADLSYVPLDMPGHTLLEVNDVAECQEVCKKTIGCAYFSFYEALRDCHLQDSTAVRLRSTGFIAGPPACKKGIIKKFPESAEKLEEGQGPPRKRLGALLFFGAVFGASVSGAFVAFRRSRMPACRELFMPASAEELPEAVEVVSQSAFQRRPLMEEEA